MRHPRRSIALAIAGVLPIIGGAQSSPPAAPSQQPVFKSRANFVRVDVYPTRGGVPVQDLTADDFEIQEDGKPQRVETFEHVAIRPAGPQDARSEPSTIDTSKQAAANPRARVFVLYLDVPHVTIDGTWHVREPLLRLIDRILGPDDLIGIMTPSMAASDLVLARKTLVLNAGLRDRWPWGERFTLAAKSDRELLYEACYPPTRIEAEQGKVVSDLARELTARRRERATLDSLQELVRYLQTIRDERKAILTITEGWLLFRANQTLTGLRADPLTGEQDPIPGVSPIGVGPDGRLGTTNVNNPDRTACDRERQHLAFMDDDVYFRAIIDEANLANASFYTVDPRGLAVFDNPIGPDPPPPAHIDARLLRERQETLRTLAGATDGMTVIGSNDLDKGFKRIADDLTSYYLLGYYSTNQKADGAYHAIKVRVKRPGVDVRARNGYRAASQAELNASVLATSAPAPAMASPIAAALGTLDRLRPGSRFHVNAVPGAAAGAGVSTIWVAGELLPAAGEDPWGKGATAEIDVSGGGASGTGRATLAAGERTFVIPITLSPSLAAGRLDVRVRLSGATALDRTTDSTSLDLAASAGRPLLFRRGPSTGNRLQPVAAFQFSRTERARFEIPLAAGATPGASRLLDKTGKPLGVPVSVGERGDGPGSGERWLTADITLAPLAPGDYIVEIGQDTPRDGARTVAAFRVVR